MGAEIASPAFRSMPYRAGVLSFEDIHKTHADGGARVTALAGLDLAIDEPGLYALMGPSGSGKSTALHLAGGLDAPDRGRVTVGGRALTGLSERALARRRGREVGLIFQAGNLIATLTARENASLPGWIDRRSPAWVRGRVDALFAALDVSERAEHRPAALSGGERQRVAVARALLFEPPVLLADEPTGSLDPAAGRRLLELLSGLADEKGITVLMVTHEAHAAIHARRVAVLAAGRCVDAFPTGDMDAVSLAARVQRAGGAA